MRRPVDGLKDCWRETSDYGLFYLALRASQDWFKPDYVGKSGVVGGKSE
jgi:hypothetical protein